MQLRVCRLQHRHFGARRLVQLPWPRDIFKKKNQFHTFDVMANQEADPRQQKLVTRMQERLRLEDMKGDPLPAYNSDDVVQRGFVERMQERLRLEKETIAANVAAGGATIEPSFNMDEPLGCEEQALEVGKRYPNKFAGLVLSMAGFSKPVGNTHEYKVCFTCYNSLMAPSRQHLPPAESLANNTFTGKCWLPKLTTTETNDF